MDRRIFLNWVGVGFLATSLPVSIAALFIDKESPAQAASGDFKPVGTVDQLKSQGKILVTEGSSGGILVIPDPKQPANVLAVNPTCTHQSCTLEWKADQKTLVCPCHNSRFAANGKVLRGPATLALKTYKAKIEGDQVLVGQ